MVEYLRAIKRPFTDLGKLIIGIILTTIPIANFAVVGYWLECAKTSMKINYKLPDWKMSYFWEGIMIALIAFGYLTAIFIILGIILRESFWVAIKNFEGISITTLKNLSLANWSFSVIIMTLLFLLVYYIFTIAILKYVTDKSFGSLFQFGDIFKKAFTVTYFKIWLIMTIYMVTLQIIFDYVPYIGTSIATFIGQVSFFTAIGKIYPKL